MSGKPLWSDPDHLDWAFLSDCKNEQLPGMRLVHFCMCGARNNWSAPNYGRDVLEAYRQARSGQTVDCHVCGWTDCQRQVPIHRALFFVWWLHREPFETVLGRRAIFMGRYQDRSELAGMLDGREHVR